MNKGFLKKFLKQIDSDKAAFYQYVDNVKYLRDKLPLTIVVRLSESWKKYEDITQMLVDMSETDRIDWVMTKGKAWLKETAQ